MPAALQPGQARVTHIVPDAYSGPSEGPAEESGGGGGSFLTQSVGPLPMWIWLIAGAGLTYIFYRRSKSSSVGNPPVATGTQNTGLGNLAGLQADPNGLSDAAALANAINNLDTNLKNQHNPISSGVGSGSGAGSNPGVTPPSKVPGSPPNPNRSEDKPPPKTGGSAIPAPHLAASRYKPNLEPLYANSFSQPGGPGYSPLLGHRGMPTHRGASMNQQITSDEPSNLAGRAERASFQDRPAVTARQPMARGSKRSLPVTGAFSRAPIAHPSDPNGLTRNLNARRVA